MCWPEVPRGRDHAGQAQYACQGATTCGSGRRGRARMGLDLLRQTLLVADPGFRRPGTLRPFTKVVGVARGVVEDADMAPGRLIRC